MFNLFLSSYQCSEWKQFLPIQALVFDNYFSHHVLIAEKSTHQIHLFENNNGKAVLLKSFQMATGKKSGDKLKEGDFKTPEGIYYFNNFMTKDDLLKKAGKEAKIYGAGAFISNYPNEIDKIYHKKGSGIWLHSTNDETRIDKGLDSRGCVVVNNKDLVEISKYIELQKTPLIITQDLQFLKSESHELLKNELVGFFNSWVESWRMKDIEVFMSHYDAEHFIDAKGSFNQFKKYKGSLFSLPGTPKIEVSHLTILNEKKYAVIEFIQNYQSRTISDMGKKELYVVKNEEGKWQILRETWSKDGIDEHLKIAFEPRALFFKDN
jgi:murein L,D-transpeptidase YafK